VGVLAGHFQSGRFKSIQIFGKKLFYLSDLQILKKCFLNTYRNEFTVRSLEVAESSRNEGFCFQN
jgi:hypothetical protein